MNVLISGAGIAGPTLAFLAREIRICVDAGRERAYFAD